MAAVLSSALLLLYASTTAYMVFALLNLLSTIFLTTAVIFELALRESYPQPILSLAAGFPAAKTGYCVMTGSLTVNVCFDLLMCVFRFSWQSLQDTSGRRNRVLESFSALARKPFCQSRLC